MSKVAMTKAPGSKSLDDRIADAFEAELSSTELKALLDEVSVADAAAKAESQAASKVAFDPAVRPAKVAEARKAMEDADFRSRRMSAATGSLGEHLQAAIKREDASRLRKLQDEAIAERDQIVADLPAYIQAAAIIENLMTRVAANNAHLVAAFGLAGQFQTAERIARGLPESWIASPTPNTPPLIEGVRLPKFRSDNNHGFLWPPASTPVLPSMPRNA